MSLEASSEQGEVTQRISALTAYLEDAAYRIVSSDLATLKSWITEY